MDIASFGARYNKLTGTLPLSLSAWKKMINFQVQGNQLSGGPLPELPFPTVGDTICALFTNRTAPTNQFTCPWPAGAVAACTTADIPITNHTGIPITDADCTGFSCDAATGQCVTDPKSTQSAVECVGSCKAPTYSCNAATGQCAADPQGTQTAQGCDATCKAPMYSCNTTAGKCVEDPSGTQTAQSCIGSCKCVAPHNCGQLNGTMQCGAVLAGCNVCASCCQDYFHQHSCDGCFAAPPSEQGCGGNASTV